MSRTYQRHFAAGRLLWYIEAGPARYDMICYVYVLGCESGSRPLTYVGWTTDLDQRLEQHNSSKGAKSTRGRKWVLLYAERHNARSEAMSREWHLKRDREFRKALRSF